MKKIKYYLVAVMAVILCLMCLMTTTFSWFTRGTKTGNSLTWNSDYQVSDGADIDMATYKLNTSSGEYEQVASNYNFSNSDGIPSGERVCYRTDITNSGENAQSVSLYMSGLKINQGDFYLGVNQPLKTYKNIENSRVATTMDNGGKIRIYFQHKNKWGGETFVVFYSTTNDDPTAQSKSIELYHIGVDSNNYHTYYAELPSDTKKVYFAKQFYGLSNDYERTDVINLETENITQNHTKVVYLTDAGVNNGKADYSMSSVVGANIIEYYETITITKGEKFNAALTSGQQYTGTIQYSSTGSAISVSGSEITANSVGTATFTTTVTGSSYKDKFIKTTTVNVVDGDIPIVTNYLIPQAVDENTPSTVSVYWYINNEGTEALKYEIADVYLSL